jgi:hypothetical protein
VGLPGNEAADRAAKEATEHPDTDIREVPTLDIKNNIKNRITESWQSEWDASSFKLKEIKDTGRKFFLTRLRIGHVLVHCANFQTSRQEYQLRGGLHKILGNNDEGIARLLTFLRDSGLYMILKSNISGCIIIAAEYVFS